MSAELRNDASLNLVGLQELKKNWGWFLALGMLLMVLGAVAIGRACLMTLASMVFFGWLLIIAGVVEAVHSFWRQRNWSGFFLDLLTGLLYAVVGLLVVSNPLQTSAALTLLISMFLIFGGVFRIAAALSVRYPHWGWVLLHGIVQLALGVMIWKNWPVSGLWVIGFFIGIEMFCNGWTLVMLAMVGKKLPEVSSAASEAH